jgi:ribosomal protein L1
VIEDVSTALRQNREKEIALPELKVELAIHLGIDVHQPDRATELVVAFPHTLDFNEPYMVLCFHDLAREDILGVVEPFGGRNGIA